MKEILWNRISFLKKSGRKGFIFRKTILQKPKSSKGWSPGGANGSEKDNPIPAWNTSQAIMPLRQMASMVRQG